MVRCSLCAQTGHNKAGCPHKKASLVQADAIARVESAEMSKYDTQDSSVMDTPDIAIIRKLATEVLDALGAGHTESVYHNAMKVGIQDENLKYETERDIVLKFRGRYVGTVRADLIVEARLVIELKSSSGTDTSVSDAIDQCRIYMRETNIASGIVVVFPKRVGGKLKIAIA